jgi:hypothetical protein
MKKYMFSDKKNISQEISNKFQLTNLFLVSLIILSIIFILFKIIVKPIYFTSANSKNTSLIAAIDLVISPSLCATEKNNASN